MSEKMYPIPFDVSDELGRRANTRSAAMCSAFISTITQAGKSLPIFGERIETPFGPAAGPNSQLAQNIIAAYCRRRALFRGQDRAENGRRGACRLCSPPLYPRR